MAVGAVEVAPSVTMYALLIVSVNILVLVLDPPRASCSTQLAMLRGEISHEIEIDSGIDWPDIGL